MLRKPPPSRKKSRWKPPPDTIRVPKKTKERQGLVVVRTEGGLLLLRSRTHRGIIIDDDGIILADSRLSTRKKVAVMAGWKERLCVSNSVSIGHSHEERACHHRCFFRRRE